MRSRTPSPGRVLPDGTPLQNRLLASLPTIEYDRIARHLRLEPAALGDPLHDHGRRIDNVYFPNGGVFSITNRMRDGTLVEVATVGREGMLGVGVFLGDRSATGRTFLQVADGSVVALAVARFVEETGNAGSFREVIGLYAQASLLQTHDRVDADDFALKHEFLAMMLGVRRGTVTVVLGALQEAGLISSRYGHMRVLKRKNLEAASCECYAVIRRHFTRLGL